ncbi:MAG TPA: hypothetical protein VM532_09085, partial [Burkholderiales bacterium]|nr:hypothetical protein [Burkholderiales bacterium]
MNKPPSELQFSTHADRLFVESNKQALRGSHGLPTEPSEWNAAPQNAWSAWDEVSCVVVLGEPGSGKSREFLHQHEILKK